MPMTFSDEECALLLEAVGEHIEELQECAKSYRKDGDTDSCLTVESCIMDLRPIYDRLIAHNE